MIESTCAIIKPDALKNLQAGQIISLIELNKFVIERLEKVHITRTQAEAFYAVHKERPFFGELVSYMTSGFVIIMELKKENAVQEWRNLMGATDPVKAHVGTIRYMFGTHIGSNATHGSDSVDNAKTELKIFFAE